MKFNLKLRRCHLQLFVKNYIISNWINAKEIKSFRNDEQRLFPSIWNCRRNFLLIFNELSQQFSEDDRRNNLPEIENEFWIVQGWGLEIILTLRQSYLLDFHYLFRTKLRKFKKFQRFCNWSAKIIFKRHKMFRFFIIAILMLNFDARFCVISIRLYTMKRRQSNTNSTHKRTVGAYFTTCNRT